MSELEQLTSKSKEDLAAIAVQFGDFTPEVAATKTKEELIAAITRTPISSEEDKATKKPAKKTTKTASKTTEKKPAKKTKAPTKKTDEPVAEEVKTEEVKVVEETPVEKTSAKEKKPAAKSKKTSKKKTEDAPAVEAPKAEAPEAEAPAEKKPKKTARKSKKETAEPAADVANEVAVEPATEVTAETPAEEAKPEAPAKKTSRKPSKRGSKKVAEEASAEETPAEETASETPVENAPVEEAKPVEGERKSRGRNSRKRRLSFGPSQEVKEVAIPEGEQQEEAKAEGEAEAAPEEPKQPEIVYTEIEGILSIGGSDNKNEFCGFVHKTNYLPGEEDAYVPGQIIKRMGLRRGDKIKGLVAPPRGKDKYAPLRKVLAVNDIEIPEDSDFEVTRRRPKFENLTAVYPDQRLTLETSNEDLSSRIIDLFCPIGKGQRGMIVSPPKAGKTVLMKRIANSITTNSPDCKVIVLLIDERPEEVTDMQRSIKGEVVYSTFDKRPENHVRVTELVLERAMRLVELGQDVVILLDSMTRLGRAYNLTVSPSGRTLSGGLDPASLYGPKRFFGAARNIENGGSLTIIATALIETGSKMDEVIFEEFKGTGNMEVVLDRKLADRRVYPAIAVDKSGTRREDLLLTPEELESVWLTRKAIADVDTIAATEAVINFMKRTPSNSSFVLSAKKSFSVD
ncbi:MAG: transcription termination factor Rho [Saccharofermentans sp.]|nr:transcription termination factor Rho [Saccharofermentans sp.]